MGRSRVKNQIIFSCDGGKYMSMRVLLIDAFDSFVFNIAQYYEKFGVITQIVRVDDDPIGRYHAWRPQLLVLGPGPGMPQEHGYLDIISALDKNQALFGVCLGHQAIGEFFGWKLMHAPTVEHGKKALIQHDKQGIFLDVPLPASVIRYHSLAISNVDTRKELITTAFTEKDNVTMAVRHRMRPIESVQFHPESIGTENGIKMICNSLKLVNDASFK
jgi:anthranilate synthase component 2